jgi:predicted phage terminase large subunit-like protein
MDEGISPSALQKAMWRAYPHTFAQHASQGQWLAYAWLRYISLLITPKIIQGNGRFLLSAPPQHGKSEFLSNWLPTWFLSNFQMNKVILGTYGQDYANKWGSKVRENLTDNPLCAIPMRKDTASKKKFMTSKGGQMMVAGVDGPATGEGAHLFIVDDPYKNPDEAMKPNHREHVMNWFLAVANTRLQAGGSIVVMHTRWNDDDLIGDLSKKAGWTSINLEAVCEHPELDPLGRKQGQALCPERYTEADLKQKRIDVTDLFWFPMFQGTPTDMKGSIVTTDDIRYYDEHPSEKIKTMDEIGIFADLTYEKDEENDFAVFECWGRKGPDIFHFTQIREKMGINEQLTAFEKMLHDHPDAFHKEIEKKANGAAVIQLCEDKIPGIVANNPHTSKGARLAAVSPLYKSGNVYYPNPDLHGNEYVRTVNVYEITRMTLAGTKTKHDDTVDVATMAVAHFGRMSSALARLEALTRR